MLDDPTLNKGIQSEQPRAENQDNQCGHQEHERRSRGKLIGITQKSEQGFTIADDVGYEHVHGEHQSDQPGAETEEEQNASHEFECGYEGGGRAGSGQAETGEKRSYAFEIVELAPAVLRDLEAPVEAHEEQKGRLKIRSGPRGPGVESRQLCEQMVHGDAKLLRNFRYRNFSLVTGKTEPA